jgi:hypothetical protein
LCVWHWRWGRGRDWSGGGGWPSSFLFWHWGPWVSPAKSAAEAARAEEFDADGGAEDSVAFAVEGGDVFKCPKLDLT